MTFTTTRFFSPTRRELTSLVNVSCANLLGLEDFETLCIILGTHMQSVAFKRVLLPDVDVESET